MEKVFETRKKICRYTEVNSYLKTMKNFGWEINNKILLNRFGNPLNPNENVSESDLREKCSYELTLQREVEKDSISKLNSLEMEYESEKYLDAFFGRGRVTACVFLTLAVIVFFILAFSPNENAVATAFAVLAFVALLGLIAVVLTGALSVYKRCQYNDNLAERKKQILKEARDLLESKISE